MPKISNDKLKDLFDTFDRNSDGYIDENEAKAMFEILGFDFSKYDVQMTTFKINNITIV